MPGARLIQKPLSVDSSDWRISTAAACGQVPDVCGSNSSRWRSASSSTAATVRRLVIGHQLVDEVARALGQALERRRVEHGAVRAAVELGDQRRRRPRRSACGPRRHLALAPRLAEQHERERLAQRPRLLDLLVGLVEARPGLDRAAADDVGRGRLDRAAAEHRHHARLDLRRQPVGLRVAAGAVEVALDRACARPGRRPCECARRSTCSIVASSLSRRIASGRRSSWVKTTIWRVRAARCRTRASPSTFAGSIACTGSSITAKRNGDSSSAARGRKTQTRARAARPATSRRARSRPRRRRARRSPPARSRRTS